MFKDYLFFVGKAVFSDRSRLDFWEALVQGRVPREKLEQFLTQKPKLREAITHFFNPLSAIVSAIAGGTLIVSGDFLLFAIWATLLMILIFVHDKVHTFNFQLKQVINLMG